MTFYSDSFIFKSRLITLRGTDNNTTAFSRSLSNPADIYRVNSLSEEYKEILQTLADSTSSDYN